MLRSQLQVQILSQARPLSLVSICFKIKVYGVLFCLVWVWVLILNVFDCLEYLEILAHIIIRAPDNFKLIGHCVTRNG